MPIKGAVGKNVLNSRFLNAKGQKGYRGLKKLTVIGVSVIRGCG
jgi:hypothetical protein